MKQSIRVWVLVLGLLMSTPAKAEFYMGGGTGPSSGGKITGAGSKFNGCAFFFFGCFGPFTNEYSGSSLNTDSALASGVKIGFFSNNPRWDWVGIELQYFQRDLEVSRQPWSVQGNITTNLIPTQPFNGQVEWDLSVKTIGLLFMFRIPPRIMAEKFNLPRWEPYLGLGFSTNPIKVGQMRTYDNAGNQVGASSPAPGSATANGFLFSIGLNFRMYKGWKLFGEFKRSSIDVDDDPISGFDTESGRNYRFRFELEENIFMFGVTYSFGLPSS